MAQKIANRLDDALISGAITQDQYLAAGGRSPEIMLQGLRRGSDALVDRHRIREIRSARDLASPDTWRRAALRRVLSDPRLGGASYDSDDWKALRALRSADSWPEASLDELFSKLDREGQVFKDIEKKVDAKVGPYRRNAIARALRPEAIEASGAHASPGSHIYTPAALSTVDRDPFEADFQAELTRRHEIDEDRYSHLGQKSEKTLRSFGHVHPRVILNEHANIARAPKNVRDAFIDARNSSYEVPSYNVASGGRFEYGKALKGSKRSIENSIADKIFWDPDALFDARIEALEEANAMPLDFNRLKAYTRQDFTDPLVDAIAKAPDTSLLGRLSKFIIKHSEYDPSKETTQMGMPRLNKIANRLDDALIAGHITHDQYLAAGGRTPETMLRGMSDGSDALVKRRGIKEIRTAKELASPEPYRREMLKEILESPGWGGAPLGGDDWRAIRDVQKSKAFDDASLDALYAKLDRKGIVFKDIEKSVNPTVNAYKRLALANAFSLGDTEARTAHSLYGSHIYTPTAATDTLGTKIRNLFGKGKDPFEALFEAELIRRHEVDEYRYNKAGRKSKKTLKSFGHGHPRVILNEHANVTRAPKNVRDVFLDLRKSSYETPAYNVASGGRFEYGKGIKDIPIKPGGSYDFNAAKRSIENAIADEVHGDVVASSAARQKALKKAKIYPSVIEQLKSALRGAGKSVIVNTLLKAPDKSLLGRLSNFIIKHSEYDPPKKSHLKIAHDLGAQAALEELGLAKSAGILDLLKRF